MWTRTSIRSLPAPLAGRNDVLQGADMTLARIRNRGQELHRFDLHQRGAQCMHGVGRPPRKVTLEA